MIDIRKMKNQAAARLLAKYPSIFEQWAKNADILTFTDVPWAPLTKEIEHCRLALFTTGGVHLKNQPRFDMLDSAGDPSVREIPFDVSSSDLIITHNYYDSRDAKKDINVILPIERVIDLASQGEINSVNQRHFSFMGHIKDQYIDALLNDTAPRVVSALKADGADIVILTPG